MNAYLAHMYLPSPVSTRSVSIGFDNLPPIFSSSVDWLQLPAYGCKSWPACPWAAASKAINNRKECAGSFGHVPTHWDGAMSICLCTLCSLVRREGKGRREIVKSPLREPQAATNHETHRPPTYPFPIRPPLRCQCAFSQMSVGPCVLLFKIPVWTSI